MATALKTVSASPCGQQSRMYERHYSPAELAEVWNLSADTVRRMFEGRRIDGCRRRTSQVGHAGQESAVAVAGAPPKSSTERSL